MTKQESASKHHVCRCRAPHRPTTSLTWYQEGVMRADNGAAAVAESHIRTEEAVRRRAYGIYCERGRQPGSELEDWLAAEREIVGGAHGRPGRNP